MCLQAVPAMVESTTELERVGRDASRLRGISDV